jgi:hypothetical protein
VRALAASQRDTALSLAQLSALQAEKQRLEAAVAQSAAAATQSRAPQDIDRLFEARRAEVSVSV